MVITVKKFVLAAFAALSIAAVSSIAYADVQVRGYTRSDGTYVQPHVRTNPDGNPYNNYSCIYGGRC
jgi:hypothetical protein